jgi:DNA-binding transcriptional ArsR family regulator
VHAPTPYPGGPEAGLSDNIHRIFHALGDPTRRALVERLSEAPVTVSQLAEPLAITLAAVVQHLQILEESGLVRTEKIGRVRTCRIEPKGFSVMEQWIRDRRTTWERRFDRLGEFLSETVESQDE